MTDRKACPPLARPLAIVTGAPGAGKTATVAALLPLPRDYLVFDADWLLPDLSVLAGRPLAEAEDLWPPYRRLWATIARMVERNGRLTVLAIPLEPRELAEALPDDWRGAVRWCLLDCDDGCRTSRLLARGWDDGAIIGAITDARTLRDQISFAIDTGSLAADAVALRVDRWLRESGGDAAAPSVARTGTVPDVL